MRLTDVADGEAAVMRRRDQYRQRAAFVCGRLKPAGVTVGVEIHSGAGRRVRLTRLNAGDRRVYSGLENAAGNVHSLEGFWFTSKEPYLNIMISINALCNNELLKGYKNPTYTHIMS